MSEEEERKRRFVPLRLPPQLVNNLDETRYPGESRNHRIIRGLTENLNNSILDFLPNDLREDLLAEAGAQKTSLIRLVQKILRDHIKGEPETEKTETAEKTKEPAQEKTEEAFGTQEKTEEKGKTMKPLDRFLEQLDKLDGTFSLPDLMPLLAKAGLVPHKGTLINYLAYACEHDRAYQIEHKEFRANGAKARVPTQKYAVNYHRQCPDHQADPHCCGTNRTQRNCYTCVQEKIKEAEKAKEELKTLPQQTTADKPAQTSNEPARILEAAPAEKTRCPLQREDGNCKDTGDRCHEPDYPFCTAYKRVILGETLIPPDKK
jgi:hypothetical protein